MKRSVGWEWRRNRHGKLAGALMVGISSPFLDFLRLLHVRIITRMLKLKKHLGSGGSWLSWLWLSTFKPQSFCGISTSREPERIATLWKIAALNLTEIDRSNFLLSNLWKRIREFDFAVSLEKRNCLFVRRCCIRVLVGAATALDFWFCAT